MNELASRRPAWSVIPLASAQLEQQELSQGNLTDEEVQAKEETIIHAYRRAVDLGQRSSAIVRETVKLLFKNKRGSEALDLLNSIPLESQLAGDLGRQASKFAVENRDFQRAADIARKMVDAAPGDFQERLWLVQILLSSGRQADAETEIRKAVDLAKTDSDRWITLVRFMIITKQLEKARKAIKDAEVVMPPDQAPLALAQCCEMLGKAYEQSDDGAMKEWYAEAGEWYEKAETAHPDDFSIMRRLANFYRQTKQIVEAEAQLNAILKGSGKLQNAERVAWARRTLADVLSTDRRRVGDALALLEEAGQTANGAQGAKAFENSEDLRVLARVLDAQQTKEHRKRAIETLESLVGTNLANADDRFLLARLYEISGDWPRAQGEYRELNLRTKNTRDMETLNRRPFYLGQFVNGLLRNHKANDDQDLVEAEDLVDELKQIQPDQLHTLVLQIEIARARNQMDKAMDLIQTSASRSDFAPLTIKTLAELAEKLGHFDVAERLYRRYDTVAKTRDSKDVLAKFLSRRGHLKDALDLFEPLWANPHDAEIAAGTCIPLILSTSGPFDAEQFDRVTRSLEQAIKQKTNSALLLAGLGNCRERQEFYDEAKRLYESVIKQSSPNAVESPNTKGLIAASYNNLAWLLALRDHREKDALVDINNAIKLVGPLPDFLDTRGVIYLRLKQTAEAIKDLQTAVEADPSPAKSFHLAQAYLQANNKEKARQCLGDATQKQLEQLGSGPGGLHPLEQAAYQKVLSELGSQ